MKSALQPKPRSHKSDPNQNRWEIIKNNPLHTRVFSRDESSHLTGEKIETKINVTVYGPWTVRRCLENSNSGKPECFGSSLWRVRLSFRATTPTLIAAASCRRGFHEVFLVRTFPFLRHLLSGRFCPPLKGRLLVAWTSTSRIHDAYNSLREASGEMRVDLSPIHSDSLFSCPLAVRAKLPSGWQPRIWTGTLPVSPPTPDGPSLS